MALHFRLLWLFWEKFRSDGSLDRHIKSLVVRNKPKLDGFYWFLHNFVLDLRAQAYSHGCVAI